MSALFVFFIRNISLEIKERAYPRGSAVQET